MAKILRCAWLVSLVALTSGESLAEARYDPGATDTTIRIGNTAPYSGPVSAYSAQAKAAAAYFKMINEQGGINGRKIELISLDDAYSPSKTVEAVRRLVESDQVLLMYGMAGTAPSTAVQKYLNAKGVPQLFVYSGAAKWAEPTRFRWTMGWFPSYVAEAEVYARYILSTVANPRIAVLYQADDFGKDYLIGLKRGLGDQHGAALVAEASYQPTEPTVDSQLFQLKASGANVLVIAALGRAASQAIQRSAEIGWEGQRILSAAGLNVDQVLRPAGLDNAKGLVSTTFRKEPYLPEWASDKGAQDYLAWMRAYNPDVNVSNDFYITGYSMAQTMVDVLRRCGDDLTRDNVVRQAASIRDLELPLLLPGVKLNTSPADYSPIESLRLVRFDGERWAVFGEPMGADAK